MSGTRQHFIPRFLQEPFASHKSGSQAFTWVYRKGAKPFNTNIINVGVEGQFYSKDNDGAVDDEITRHEEDLAPMCRAIRIGSPEALHNTRGIGALLAHLEMRTRHLRAAWLSTGTRLVDQLLGALENPATLTGFFTRYLADDPTRAEKLLVDAFRERGVPEVMIPGLLRQVAPLLSEFLSKPMVDGANLIAQIRPGMPSALAAGAKSGHIKALAQTLAPPVRVDQYSKLVYDIRSDVGSVIPLGDSVLVFEVNEAGCFKPIWNPSDRILRVYCPLAPDAVLVGSADTTVLQLDGLPTAIAECSLEYFIAPSAPDANNVLHQLIGKQSSLLSQEELDVLVAEHLGL